MNRKNLSQIIDNYIEKFGIMNNEVHKEYCKWESVKHFKDNWDIDAADFAGMFKEAVRKTWILINNGRVQPTNGIIKLAERPELTEIVREMFRRLYADDGGDIEMRQKRISDFIAEADRLLNEYEKGKWKYTQEVRAVIDYLALMYPEQNYLYKPTQARAFMNCVQYGDDFGGGRYFSLEKYYRMCDELVEEIKKRPELIEMHTNRLTDEMYRDDDFHILAYDIIYCAVVYNLYSNIEIPKKEKQSKSGEDTAKIASYHQELAQLEELYSQTLLKRAEYDGISAKGMIVKHRIYGDGIVVEHNESSVCVRFANCEKKFMLPQGFTERHLMIESEDDMNIFIEIDKLDKRINRLKNDIISVKIKINGYK